MRAMILAAGRGERMRPLTDSLPKPLLQVGGKPLIVWHIEKLVAAGITELVVNLSWLGEQIELALGDGGRFGAKIQYSREPQALETAGGIAQALPFFQEQPFLVINGDVWCDWNLAGVEQAAASLDGTLLAWLMLVDNPVQHPEGDFQLHSSRLVTDAATHDTAVTLTFSGIGIYRPALFQGLVVGQPASLAPLLRQSMAAGKVAGYHYKGQWTDVGTPQRLMQLDEALR
ncbi:mannose-1-phosphate guanylyltransferase [Pollutimonas nitritireducens]|uniref:Mannose-1-phosphate guanylyltransferase n=1 Tax=Pollutimonas nitritireducens TaxID=2045209 RepID=A0A2N4UK63_9BURK|nr:nucleotidyltransferase family protein [Pollutimonas nitritireducens]PLC55413.1 mannose-1-phosphate guanylyltransferase [Pollutimonas nitritireducens]